MRLRENLRRRMLAALHLDGVWPSAQPSNSFFESPGAVVGAGTASSVSVLGQ
eukprot:CAMPEP_0176271784 /NCGR_PEP_ID=MMETSP0121_2-20121125/45380_1 /TAXON_ID=160619 /ORGANISM="Kryptoperidinium foliaceum, Strain CCMP 1326" /LENGTH=51 /DNA_ID=CAMNT_0017611943 /DNA_START=109 /DNA_END=261 /DNA_ORIENTATION=+